MSFDWEAIRDRTMAERTEAGEQLVDLATAAAAHARAVEANAAARAANTEAKAAFAQTRATVIKLGRAVLVVDILVIIMFIVMAANGNPMVLVNAMPVAVSAGVAAHTLYRVKP